MKKLLLVLGLLLAATNAHAQSPLGPPNQILCNKAATLAVGPTAITQIVAAVSGQTIFICGWHITNTGASGTWSLSYGTGSNCGTGTTTLVPAQSVTSSSPATDHVDYAQLSTPVSQALCVTPSVATIAVLVWYTQL